MNERLVSRRRQWAVCVVGVLSMAATDCGGQPTPFNPTTCPPPTAEQCAFPQTPCDEHFVAQAKTDVAAACSLLLVQSAQSEATRYVKRPVLTTTLYNGEGAHPPAGEVIDARQVPEQGPRVITSAIAGPVPASGEPKYTVAGLSALGFVGEAQRSLVDPSLQLALVSNRLAWEANDGGVASCAEYVYEKFYDYRVFADAVTLSRATKDPRKIFDLAYQPFPAPRTALGTRHLVDQTLRQRDGVTPSGVAFAFEQDLPKNDFFRVPLSKTDGGVQALGINFVANPSGEDAISNSSGQGLTIVTISMKNLQRPLALDGLVPTDPTLAPVLRDGGAFYDESFEWHLQMNVRNQGVLDEQLLRLEAKKAQFRQLLVARERVVEQLALQFSDKWSAPSFGSNQFEGQWFRDPLWNPDPTRRDHRHRPGDPRRWQPEGTAPAAGGRGRVPRLAGEDALPGRHPAPRRRRAAGQRGPLPRVPARGHRPSTRGAPEGSARPRLPRPRHLRPRPV